jgi:hypothetical protein
MTKSWLKLPLIALAVILAASLAFAQNGDIPTVAGVQNDSVVISTGGAPITADAAAGGLAGLAWSPDGSRLAYINRAGELRVVDAAGVAVQTLATGVSYLPPTFSTDGQAIYYATEGESLGVGEGSANARPSSAMTVNAVNITSGVSTVIGEFPFQVGCGGGSPYPMDALYSTGAGFMGNALTFAVTEFGLLHSVDCDGTGLGLFDLTNGQDLLLIPDGFGRAVVSPSGTQVAGVAYNENMQAAEIQVLDIATGSVAVLASSISGLDQLGWGDDGSVYYSTRTTEGALPLQLTGEERAAFEAFYGSPDQIPGYTVTVNRIDPNGTVSQLLSGPGWAITNLFASGDWLYFNQIPTGEAWVYGVARGEIDPTTEAGGQAERSAVAPLLVRIPVTGGESEVVGGGVLLGAVRP